MQARVERRTGLMVILAALVFVIGMALVVPVWLRAGDLVLDRIGQLDPRDSAPRSTLLPGAFTYQQQRPLSCEYASLHIATAMLGEPVSEYAFDNLVPLDENPHRGYRGNILGDWGNTTDYGVYAGPLAAALPAVGFEGEAFYGSRADLERALDAGKPVVVWLGFWGSGGSFDAWSETGERYQLTPGMHVVVAYGYDEHSVYLTDPGSAAFRTFTWDEFIAKWEVMDGMALAVSKS